MRIFCLTILLLLLGWKGWHAWLRGQRAYRQDRQEHDSLREYLLVNGATTWQSLKPFYRHALTRALKPLAAQWRLFAVLLALGLLVLLVW